MRSSAKPTHSASPLLAVLLLAAPRWANAHDEITLFSNQDGTGKLVVADFDPSEPVQVLEALCIGGLCLYTSSSPGIVAPAEDRPSESLFGLHGPKTVSLEIVAAHTAASLRIGATVLSAPGQSAALGTTPDLHAHGEWRVLVSQGTYGQFPIRFKLKAPGYADSDPIELLLSNATPSPTPTATPSPTPTPSPAPTTPPTPSPTLSATPTPAPTGPALAHYLLYRAKGSKLPTPADHHRFPKNWHLLLDDVGLADEPPGAFPDDPENYTVKAVTGLANPARKNAETPPPSSSQPYLRYGITEAKEGAGAPRPDGRFPKAVPAPPRLWGLSNQFGSLNVETGKVRSLWIPASVNETGTPPAPSDATHYLCYQAKASKLPSDQAPDTRGSGKGSFRKDLQAFVLDGFEDCASLADGRTVPFAGTAVAGTCLVDIKAPREICRPAAKSAVVPPRTSAAQVAPSTPAIPDHSLLCYKVVLATQVRSTTAGALGGLPLGTKLAQAKLPKREARFGTAVATSPGNGFPRPRAADLKALEQLCVPTTVDWVAER